MRLRVATWNVLADGYDEPEAFPYSAAADLAWKTRWPKIKALLPLDCDVIALQEVRHYHRCFRPVLEAAGLNSVFFGKTSGSGDGCVLAWNTDTVACAPLAVHMFHYCDHGVRGMAQGAIVAPMMHIDDAKPFIVATTHLKAGGDFDRVRRAEMRVLLDQIELVRGCAANALMYSGVTPTATVILGDLNAEMHTPALVAAHEMGYTALRFAFTTCKMRNRYVGTVDTAVRSARASAGASARANRDASLPPDAYELDDRGRKSAPSEPLRKDRMKALPASPDSAHEGDVVDQPVEPYVKQAQIDHILFRSAVASSVIDASIVPHEVEAPYLPNSAHPSDHCLVAAILDL